MKSTNDNKLYRAAIRLADYEYEHLKQLANESNLSISDYIRRCVFDNNTNTLLSQIIDTKEKFACDHDRELMRIMMRTLVWVRELAKNSLSEDALNKCLEDAKTQLKEWGYE